VGNGEDALRFQEGLLAVGKLPDDAGDVPPAAHDLDPAGKSLPLQVEILQGGVFDLGLDPPRNPLVALAREQGALRGGPVLEDVDPACAGDRAQPRQNLQDVRLPGGRLQEPLGGEAGHFQDRVAVAEGLLGALSFRNVADGLDGADNAAAGIVEGRRRAGEIDPIAAAGEGGGVAFPEKDPAALHDPGFPARSVRVAGQGNVDEHGPSFPVERQGMLIIALAEHLRRRNPRHGLHGTVPGDDLAVAVDNEGGVRQEGNDVGELSLRIPQGILRPPALLDLQAQDLVGHHQLRGPLPDTLLEIVLVAVQGLLAALAVGDVERREDHPGGEVVGVDGLRTQQDVQQGAVPAPPPGLDHARSSLPDLDVLFTPHPLEFLVAVVKYAGALLRQLLGGIPEHARDLVVGPAEHAVVHDPDPDRGRLEDALQQRLAPHQGLFGAAPVRDVLRVDHEPADPAPRIENGVNAVLEPAPRPLVGEAEGMPVSNDLPDQLPAALRRRPAQLPIDGCADHSVQRRAEPPGKRLVGRNHDSVRVDEQKRFRDSIEHGACRLEAVAQGLLGPLLLRDVDTDSDDVFDLSRSAGDHRIGPGDEVSQPVFRHPPVLMTVRGRPRAQAGPRLLNPLPVLRRHEGFPDNPSDELRLGISRHGLAGPVESRDPALPVKDDHQRAGRVQHGRAEIALLPHRLLRVHALRDVLNDGIEKRSAPEPYGTAVDLDVANRPHGKSVSEMELAPLLPFGLPHVLAEGPLVEQIDVADPHGFQRAGRIPVKPDGRPVGIHDPPVSGVDEKHDRMAVTEEARVQRSGVARGCGCGLARPPGATRGGLSSPAFPRRRVAVQFAVLLLADGFLFRAPCRHGTPLEAAAEGSLQRPGNPECNSADPAWNGRPEREAQREAGTPGTDRSARHRQTAPCVSLP